MSSPVAPALIDPSQPVPDDFDVLCESCGYSLVGLNTDRCPECGARFNPNDLPLARIPWLYRRRCGSFIAYFSTVRMILFRPTAFAKELSRPVRISPDDALRFRRVTLRIVQVTAVLIALAVAGAGIGYQLHRYGLAAIPLREIIKLIVVIPMGWLALWIFIWLATDVPTFIWKGLPSDPANLAPLHHYACAPLALVPLIPLLPIVPGAIVLLLDGKESGAATAVITAWVIAAFIILALWWVPPRLMHGATGCGIGRQLLLALYLPFHWALMAILGLMIAMGVGAVIDRL